MALGASPREHKQLQPEIKYVGNMHGNEVNTHVHGGHMHINMLNHYNSCRQIAAPVFYK